MRAKLLSIPLFAAALVATPGAAKALTLNVTSGEVGLAQLCAGPLCTPEALPFVDGGSLSGTITIDGGDFSFDLTATSVLFDDTTSSFELQNVSYTAGPVAISGTPDDFTASGNLSASGDYAEDGGSSSPLNLASVPWTATCQDDAGQLKCGIVVLGYPTFPVSYSGSTHYVPHTLNPTAVPEPQVSVMALTAGLLGLAYGRRKVTS
jgi:hypothetical protein